MTLQGGWAHRAGLARGWRGALIGGALASLLTAVPASADVVSVSARRLRVAVGGEATATVRVAGSRERSCLQAVPPQGALPAGMSVRFEPPRGRGDWTATLTVRVEASATDLVGIHHLGIVELPGCVPPAAPGYAELTVEVTPGASPSPTEEQEEPSLTATVSVGGSPGDEQGEGGGSAFPWPLLLVLAALGGVAALRGLSALELARRLVSEPPWRRPQPDGAAPPAGAEDGCGCRCELTIEGPDVVSYPPAGSADPLDPDAAQVWRDGGFRRAEFHAPLELRCPEGIEIHEEARVELTCPRTWRADPPWSAEAVHYWDPARKTVKLGPPPVGVEDRLRRGEPVTVTLTVEADCGYVCRRGETRIPGRCHCSARKVVTVRACAEEVVADETRRCGELKADLHRAIEVGAGLLERVRKARANVRAWAKQVHIACDTLAATKRDCGEAEAWYWFWKVGVSLVEVATTVRGAVKEAAKAAAKGAEFSVELAKELAKELKDALEEAAEEVLPEDVKAAKDVVEEIGEAVTGDEDEGEAEEDDEAEDALDEAAEEALGEITDQLDEIAWAGVMDCERVVRLQSATVSFAMTKVCLATRDLEAVLAEVPATVRRLEGAIARGKRGFPTLCVPCDVTDLVRRAEDMVRALEEERKAIASPGGEGSWVRFCRTPIPASATAMERCRDAPPAPADPVP